MEHCMTSEKGLDLEEAIRLLENVDQYPTINQPPIKPKGGEIFLFLPLSADEQENYKCDQYRWLNSGPKEIPRKNPLVKKQYFIGKLPQGKTQAFQKHCYVLVADHRTPYPVLLHYIGDETVMVDYPHGNSRKSSNAYFATAPSVRKDIANRSKTDMPNVIINSFKQSPTSFTVNDDGDRDINPVLTPRNKSQVRNIRRKQKITNQKDGVVRYDDLLTLHSLGSELVGFTHYISTHPEFSCIVGINDFSIEIESLMKLTNNMVVFAFHECYKVGRYYITPFNFVHSTFVQQPTVPCYFLLSDTCDFDTYKKLLQTVLDNLPCLDDVVTAVITNQEYTFTSALSIVFPNWLHVYDWDILFGVARTFLRKLNLDVKDISLRMRQLKALMSLESFEDYKLELERLKKDWSMAFGDYYMQVLREPIETKLGRWHLDRYRLFNEVTGLVRCINSDLQTVIKNLQDLKDTSLDVILPSLYHLQVYLYSNIQKSLCKNGKYKLLDSFKFLRRESDELILPTKIYEPGQIVKIFRVRGITLFSESQEMGDREDNTSLLQAQRIVEMDNISHCSSLKAFLVKSTSGSLHGVQLYPRESCSCSINQRCAHIMAVMMALGMPVNIDRKGNTKSVLKPQVQTNVGDHFFVDMINSGRLKVEGTNAETLSVTDDPNEVDNQTQQVVSLEHGIPTGDVASMVLSGLYQQPGDTNIVQMNATDLETLVQGTVCRRDDGMLMVVTDAENEHGEKVAISYGIPQDTVVVSLPQEGGDSSMQQDTVVVSLPQQGNDNGVPPDTVVVSLPQKTGSDGVPLPVASLPKESENSNLADGTIEQQVLNQPSDDITQLAVGSSINVSIKQEEPPPPKRQRLSNDEDVDEMRLAVVTDHIVDSSTNGTDETVNQESKGEDIPPVELILNMSEIMHKANGS